MAIRLGQPAVRGYTWLPTDHNLLAWAYPVEAAATSGAPATAGLLYLVRLHLPVTANITNIDMFATPGGTALTAGQCFAALYTSTGALIAQTADQAAAWASAGAKTMALAGGPYNLTAGDYYAGWWHNGTTAPSWSRSQNASGGLANYGLSAPNLRFATANTALTTTAPASFGAQTAGAATYWVALS